MATVGEFLVTHQFFAHALLLVALAVFLTAGCHSVSGPDLSKDIGVIHHYGDSSGVLEAPSSVRAGFDFPIEVVTYGGGCTSAAGASVRYRGSVAVVVPYDNWRVPVGLGCTDNLTRPARTVTLRFTEPGVATIRVEGRREPESERTAVEQSVTVTPIL